MRQMHFECLSQGLGVSLNTSQLLVLSIFYEATSYSEPSLSSVTVSAEREAERSRSCWTQPLSWSDPGMSQFAHHSHVSRRQNPWPCLQSLTVKMSATCQLLPPFLGSRISDLMTWPGVLGFHCESGFFRLFPVEPWLDMLPARKILLFSNSRQMPLT